MEHRGEDASRAPADRGGKPPWEDERYAGRGLPEYGQHDVYGQAGGYGDYQERGAWPAGPAGPAGYRDSRYQDGTYSPSGPMGLPPRTGPRSFSRTGPQAVPHTGEQERYDGYDPRPGPARGDYDDYAARDGYGGAGGYGEPAAFGAPSGYLDPDGYDGGRGGQAAAARTGATGQPRPGRSGRSGRPDRSGGRGSLLLAAIAVVAVIIIGVAAYLLLFKPTAAARTPAAAGPLPTSGTAPSSQACVKKYGTYCHIELSTDDPAPLTISELFPPAFTNDADKNSFSLVSTKLDKTCSKAVIGQNLISALKAGKCTQVVRASYVSGNGKIMGTIGVVNLVSTNKAHYAGKVVGQSDFVAPLAAAKGVARKLGQGTGVVEAEFKGHYLILTWSEFTNGTTPSTKAADSELEQFSSDLVAGTANISLSQRMVTGTAPTPAS